MESPSEAQTRADGIGSGIDLDAARTVLTDWLHQHGGLAGDRRVGAITVPGGSGSTNHTLLLEIVSENAGDGPTRGLVARVKPEPAGYQRDLFEAEFRVLRALANCQEVPTPAVVDFERDRSLLGGEFFVMDQIAGQIPADNPPFNVDGFLKDATPDQRRQLWRSAVSAMARMHACHPGDLSFLERPDLASSPVTQELELWRQATSDMPGRPAVLDRAAGWLHTHVPPDARAGLAWGDARIGNMIFEDFECRAIIDWDMVSLAGSRTDLGYWILMEETWPGQRLEGFGDRAETITIWEQVTGESAGDLHWYEVFACFRLCTVLSIHMARVQVHTGTTTPADEGTLELPAEPAPTSQEPDFSELSSPLRLFAELERMLG